ncbi:hypothetical protein FRC04_005800 [Tulasnella sp. 424]|nr:hypothetical protein FRC04_005800 [Tulasnella sp. 424]
MESNLPGPPSPSCSPQTSATSHNAPYLLNLPNRQTNQDSTSSQLASASDPAFNDDQQGRSLTEQLATINYVPASATEELVDLLQVLGRAAPRAVRNKHKIYSVLRVAHDTCTYVIETGNPTAGQKDTDVKQLLDRMDHYCVVIDALEEILLEFAAILPSEITEFGPGLYSSWLQSRSRFVGILDKLCHPPFPEISYKTQDIAEDSFFDDCSWLSRLLYSGIDAEVAVQFADPPSAHPEQTRELVLDIATLLAQALAATSPNHDSELRQRESSPLTAAGRDWLIQALAE